MLIRLCFPLLVLALLAPLRAQDQPIQMTPEFCFTFPLTVSGRDVTVKYPVMINPTTILRPGMILRTMYVINYVSDSSSEDLALAHHGDMEQAYTRSTSELNGQDKLPPELAHELEGYRRTVWDVPNNFVLAMAQYPTDVMHLIYALPGKKEDIDLFDERFAFFDGLMVGLPDSNGNVTVLAVEKDSKADEAGLKAGDQIVAVGGIPTNGNLSTFAAAYSATKKQARENEVPTYTMTIRSGANADPRPVQIAMPATIKSSLMDGI